MCWYKNTKSRYVNLCQIKKYSSICFKFSFAPDTCRGDSGGPLMSVANTEYGPRYFLVGIVSFGAYKCGETPAVYTNVTAFMPFILNSMREPSSL